MRRKETLLTQEYFYHLKRKSGIYCLIIGNRKYVGSAIDLYERIKDHYYGCIDNKHRNQKIQRTYNKYKSFDVEIFAYCPPEYLIN